MSLFWAGDVAFWADDAAMPAMAMRAYKSSLTLAHEPSLRRQALT